MASKKQLKKDVNNSVGALIEEIYLWELLNPRGDFKKSEKLIDEAIALFDELIMKIHDHTEETPAKKYFNGIIKELNTKIVSISEKISKLK
tara:strand:+ start:9776 stop:10048 length:273 start_codon:yes stop_codon:yes gene_type:complete